MSVFVTSKAQAILFTDQQAVILHYHSDNELEINIPQKKLLSEKYLTEFELT